MATKSVPTFLIVLIVSVSLISLTVVDAVPLLDIFNLGGITKTPRNTGGYRGNVGAPAATRQRTGRDRFRSLCRAHNADPYAFPGRNPYPGVPLCPYN
ncbi:hypothetical protein B566_EDAN001501 [Ephemera danica]|nr:hypothetical protein B566_EDAN001501 [Ephemera danica]